MGYSRHFLTAIAVFTTYIAAQNILSFSLPLLAYEVEGTGLDLSLIKGAGFIPNVLFAIFVGVINDRIRKATGFRVYTGLLALSCLLLLLALSQNLISIPGLMLFMIVFNTIGYALGNMQLTLIRLTVPHDRLSDATSLTSGVNAVVSTIGPAVGGLALLSLGHQWLIASITGLLALSFAASFAVAPHEELKPKSPFWASLADGFRVFKDNRELVMMTVVIVLTNAAGGAFEVGLVLLLKAQMLVNDFEIGLVLAAAGLGAVLASVYAPKLRRYLGYRAAFFWPIWLLAVLCVLTALSPNIWALYVISFCEGAVALFFAIGIWSYRQETVSAEHMGRVAGLTGAIFKIGMPPVMILSGLMSDQLGSFPVFMLAAGLNVAAALFLVFVARWGWPRLRRATV